MIDIQSVDIDITGIGTKRLITQIRKLLKAEGKKVGKLQYVFCDDAYLHALNVAFLAHDTLTDIITFDYTEEFGKLSGDIFISVERVRENAEKYEVVFDEELLRVMIHGVLHLLGERDGTAQEKEQMRERENYYLSLFK